MAISFNQIPATVGVPGTFVEFDATGARRSPGAKTYKIAVFGMMSSPFVAATNPSGSTVQADIPVLVNSYEDAAVKFGRASILSHMAEAIFKTNGANETWFIPQLPPPGGSKYSMNFNYVFSLPPSGPAIISPGTEKIYLGEAVYAVSVTSASTSASVVLSFVTAINADTKSLFVASVSTGNTGVLTLTAKENGELYVDVQRAVFYEQNDRPAFVSFLTDANMSVVSNGLLNPSISAGLASIANMDFTHVILPYNDAANYALMLAEAESRWSAMPGPLSVSGPQSEFIVFRAFRGTEAQFQAFMLTANSQYFTMLHVEPKQVINGLSYAGLMSSSWQAAAAYGAKSAELTSVVANNPHQNRLLSCLKPAHYAIRGFPFNVRNRVALNYGGSTYRYDESGRVLLESGLTENLTTATGAVTDAERRVETQFTKAFLRWDLAQYFEAMLPHSRLASDGTAGLPNNVVTALTLKGMILSRAKLWVQMGLIEDFNAFKQSLLVERSTEDCNTIKFQMFPDLVNILVVKAGKISYIVC